MTNIRPVTAGLAVALGSAAICSVRAPAFMLKARQQR